MIRCCTPADLIMLLKGTGLRIQHLEIEDEVVDVYANQLVTGKEWFKRDYSYLLQLVVEEK
jgi:hypothetical protein